MKILHFYVFLTVCIHIEHYNVPNLKKQVPEKEAGYIFHL